MMMPRPKAIIAIWAPFAALFTQPVWHVQVLWIGAVLCRGPWTVASVLRVMGLGGERWFEKYHRVLNRARWPLIGDGGWACVHLAHAYIARSVVATLVNLI